MNLDTIKKQYFTKDSITDMLTRYELYYQISLGNYVLETTQDIDETYKKLEELNLQVEPNEVLSNIFEIILHKSHEEDFTEKFEYHLRTRAMMHSLKDFINNDNELISTDSYVNIKTDEILKDKYFTQSMKLQFESDYSNIFDYYEVLITNEIATQIQNNLK